MVSKIPTRHRAAGHREASATLTAELAAIDFPIRKEDLQDRVGDASVEVADGIVMPIGEMLKLVEKREFRSISHVVDALDSKWQEFRAAAGAQGEPQAALTEPGPGKHAER